MAIVKGNIFLYGVRGMVGDQMVLRRTKGGKTIMCARPISSEERTYSEPQLAQQQAFRDAIEYALSAKDQEIYILKSSGTDMSAYNLAVADWFHPPVIHSIERRNGRIRVQASDDVQVARVEVRILDSDGNVLEQGQAEQTDPLHWEYATEAAGAVEASAWDLAGNVTVGAL